MRIPEQKQEAAHGVLFTHVVYSKCNGKSLNRFGQLDVVMGGYF